MPHAGRGAKKTARTPERAFGRVLRKSRKDRSISQEELAFQSGYHRTYIGQLERGEKSPSLRTIFDLAETLKVAPSVLIQQAAFVQSC